MINCVSRSLSFQIMSTIIYVSTQMYISEVFVSVFVKCLYLLEYFKFT